VSFINTPFHPAVYKYLFRKFWARHK